LFLFSSLALAQNEAPATVLPQIVPEDNPDISEGEAKQLITDVDKGEGAKEVHDTGTYWKAPDFSKQESALGWTSSAFDVPPGFHRRMNFWIDIYTKYTTHEALLHDAHYLDIVYKILNFSDIDNNTDLSAYEKSKAKKKRIKEEKVKIREQLTRIQKLEDTPSKMTPEDQELFKKFRFVFEKNKFKVAAQRNRLRMQLGQKDRFVLGIFFSGRYIREMEKIFKDEQVPMELTRLPFVESSFNLYAYSHVGASGIWQFMRSTGKLYKLKVDSIKDLRNDPIEATRSAAKLLHFNYKLLGSWPLALTAYNHGPGGVSKIVKELKTNDINEIVWNTTRRRFGFASENFYAEFLAALEVESHAKKYFGNVQVSPPLEYDEVQLPRAMKFGELALSMKTDKDDGVERARLYNPFFTRAVLSGHRKIEGGYTVRVPKSTKDKFLAQAATVDPIKAKGLEVKEGVYKILPGDTLSTISHDFGISLKELLLANDLQSRSVLRPGQTLIIPTLENH
jgi:membrane-bound lytic murein transglycosylase D